MQPSISRRHQHPTSGDGLLQALPNDVIDLITDRLDLVNICNLAWACPDLRGHLAPLIVNQVRRDHRLLFDPKPEDFNQCPDQFWDALHTDPFAKFAFSTFSSDQIIDIHDRIVSWRIVPFRYLGQDLPTCSENLYFVHGE